MLTFLFWNLNGKNLLPSVVRLAVAHDVDILILAECNEALTPEAMLLALNPDGEEARYFLSPGNCERIRILTRFLGDYAAPIRESERYTMRLLTLPARQELLLVCAHLQSPLHAKELTLYGEAEMFAEEIRQAESQLGHRRTVVVGDLNMNPFDNGVVSATALHGVMSKQIARRETRTVLWNDYPFFYNPMWRYFGDYAGQPPGTYHYSKSDHVCYFWNIFDQVLIRPSLLDCWDDGDLRILTHDGEKAFLSAQEGLPGGNEGSDHLPILFGLKV